MRVAFYKSIRPGIQGIYSRFVRWWMRGIYSHCEIIFSDNISASASFIDGGVRFKKIDYDDTHWDFVEVPGSLEGNARDWFNANVGKKYDILGNIGFIFRVVAADKNKWFCSDALGAALGLTDSWRYCPNTLHGTLQYAYPKA